MTSNYFPLLIIFLLLNFTTILTGKTIEGLSQELKKELPPQERIDILLELSEMLGRNNPKQGYEYALKANEIAVKEHYVERQVKSLVQMGSTKMYLGEKVESLKILDESVKLAELYGYDYLVANSNHMRGLNYYMMGMDEQSLTCYHKALKINQRLGNKEENCRQLNNIALVYRDIKNHDMAISYLERSIKISKEIQSQKYLTYSTANIGYVYLDLHEYEKALPYLDELINLDKNTDSLSIAIAYNLRGLAKNGIQEYDEALENAMKSLDVSKTIKFMDGEIHVMHTISKIKVGQKKYAEAIQVAKDALKKSDETKTRRYTEGLLQTLIAATKALNNNQTAVQYQDRLLVFKDSLYNIEKSKLVDQMDIQYITREKEIENQELRAEHGKDKKIISLQKYITVLALFIGVLFIGLSMALFKSLRIKRINNQELETAIKERTKELEVKNKELIVSNQELERFAFIASHDLKEPLRNISSFANLIDIKTSASGNKELKEYASFIVGGAKQMYALIDSILRFSEIRKETDSDLSNVDLNKIVDKVKNHLSVLLKEKNVLITSGNLPQIYGDEDRFFILFKNLVENGIKYNREDAPQISIDCLDRGDYFIFSVKDNGIGINEKYSREIFEMFKRLHNRGEYSGSGMGLSICKKIVMALNGEIWVESEPGKGSTFLIQIPKNLKKKSTANTPKQEEKLVSA